MRRPPTRHLIASCSLVALLLAMGASAEPIVSVSLGASYDTGDYDQADDTDALVIPLGLRYETGDWIAKISVPFLRIDGSVVPDSGERRISTTDSGIGDVVTSLAYLIYPGVDSGVPLIELKGKVKIPTADEDDGLGTGKTDFTGEVEVSKTYGRVTPFASLGYKVRGGLDDGVVASLGATARLTDRTSIGLAYDFSEAAVSSRLRGPGPDGLVGTADDRRIRVDDSHELVPYVSHKLNDRTRLQVFGLFGLSNNSPDYGVGTQISVEF